MAKGTGAQSRAGGDHTLTEFWHTLRLTGRIAGQVLPVANDCIAGWQARAEQIPAPLLRRQALASLQRKRFHAQGGATLAADCEAAGLRPRLVAFIVALQILVDYLDNLCDRCGQQESAVMQGLHMAVIDAVTPTRTANPYYSGFPEQDDGGYLAALVHECQVQLAALPGFRDPLATEVRHLAERYCCLQVHKHQPLDARKEAVACWLAPLAAQYPDLSWWELAAACGSTLGIFALCTQATKLESASHKGLVDAYFPWISAWHILLDYYIDLAEDREWGDLNFVACYPDDHTATERLSWIRDQAERRLAGLPGRPMHRLVVRGLAGVYFSDPKVSRQVRAAPIREILHAAGPLGRTAYLLCRLGAVGR